MIMIEGYVLVTVLLGAAVALFAAELLLPTHGLLGVAGAGASIAAVVVCMGQNPWAGLVLLILLGIATPLLLAGWMRMWPHTPIGKRIILSTTEADPPPAPVHVGQSGITLSELRPMGICEFDHGMRIEAQSEHGIVPPGTAVRIIAVSNNCPTVRVVA